VVDADRIATAEDSLREMLGVEDLDGLRFLDVGAGSGLFSLAARRLGASVRSFDVDPQAVACARELKRRYRPDDADWRIEQGSALDERYLQSLGAFDVVYAWGVLHHTGAMWRALENALGRVAEGGRLMVAIYNDQGGASRRWAAVKRAYNRLPRGPRLLLVLLSFVRLWGPTMVRDALGGRPSRTWADYRRQRGMSPWYDLIDWVGGWPFEVATPQEVIDFCERRALRPDRVKTCGRGRGCNEFVFTRAGEPADGHVQPLERSRGSSHRT